MKLLGVAVASVVMCVATTALTVEAGGRRGHGHVRGHVHGSRHFDRHHDHHGHHGFRHHGHHRFKHRSVLPLFVGPSVVLATPSPVYAPPPVYVAPPVYAPPTYAIPGPPAMPRVVEFSTGRYELRGDGVSSPYTWVWIPNPPAAPPPPPPAEEPAPPVSTAPAPRPPPARGAVLYRWTDEQGVTTWTDSLEKVPARYRAQAARLAL